MKNIPVVSVIIATKNEEKNIERCFKSLLEQNYPKRKLEIVLVDNNSVDKTKEIAQEYTKLVYNFPKPGKRKNIKNFRGAQLNFGVKKSHGEIIFFPDADMTFDQNLISEAVEAINSGSADALYIPEKIIGTGFWGKVRDYDRSFYNQTCVDAVRIVKKSAYFEVGGFDEENINFGPDDWDFTKMIKLRGFLTQIITSKIYHHEEDFTFSKYFAKKGKYFKTFSGYIKKWGKNDPDVKKQFSPFYRGLIVFLEKGKWKKVVQKPHLFLAIMFIKAFVGAYYNIFSFLFLR